MSWKRTGLVLLALVVVALIYPGLPVGGHMMTRISDSEARTDLTCYSLHLTGLRRRHIRIEHDPHGPYNVTNAPCWLPPYGGS